MVQYGSEAIDENKKIVNPEYRKINYKIKKLAEKIHRREAKFYKVAEQINQEDIDEIPTLTRHQIQAMGVITALKRDRETLIAERSKMQSKIMLKEMPDVTRLNKLKPESKLFMNIIKMICYRAETAMAEIIAPHFYKEKSEKRMLIKQLFNTPADITSDEEEQTLTIRIRSLSAPRYNKAINELCEILNQTETIFPGTELKMIFKNQAD